jgi:hypothetical protein
MTISKSPNRKKIKQHHFTKIGDIYVMEDYIVAEFMEGIDINFENFYEVSLIVQSHFNERLFGFIANRINSYSINLEDADFFNKAFPNCLAYAVVNYKTIASQIFEIENQFFNFNRKSFNNIDDAINWVEQSLISIN